MNKTESETFNEYKEIFQLYDKDNDGLIDEESLLTAMRAKGFYPDDKQKNEILEGIGKSEGESYDFNEFFDIMQKKPEKNESIEAFVKQCEVFDFNETGTLSSGDVYKLFSLGEDNMSKEEINEIIHEVFGETEKVEVPIDVFIRYLMQ